MKTAVGIGLCALVLAPVAAWGQASLADASLEELLNIQVTSVSKKEQKLSRAASAVFVITSEDIRHSGAANVPDLLRMVPGVHVAQINANVWAITVRGFNSRYSNKVLVLVDGRCVYTPSFSGVYWDQQEMPLENIERIEVIRGAGATMWGANAVNGVINIITRPAGATPGGLAILSADSGGATRDLLRFGGPVGRKGSYRLFTRFSRYDSSSLFEGGPGEDGWWRGHIGFRSDWELTAKDGLSVQGDMASNRESQMLHRSFYPSPFDQPYRQRFGSNSGNVTATWNHTYAAGSATSLTAYFDTYRRSEFGVPESQKTFNIEFNHHLASATRHDTVWGVGLRAIRSGVEPQELLRFSSPQRTDQLLSAFVQDEIRVANGLWLTVGSKIEHNTYTGFEYEPSVRLAWTPSERQTWWAAASRAIRQPSRQEHGIDAEMLSYPLDVGLKVVTWLYGNPHQKSEELRDYEIGHRSQWTKRLSTDTAGFLSFYRRLSTIEPGAPVVTPAAGGVEVLTPLHYDNKGSSLMYGGEAAVNYNVSPVWRVSLGYAFLHLKSKLDPTSQDVFLMSATGNTPRHSMQVRSQLDLSSRWEWNQTMFWNCGTNSGLASNTRVDTMVTWKVAERYDVSLVGQNLLRPGQVEYRDSFNVLGTLAERKIFGSVRWRF